MNITTLTNGTATQENYYRIKFANLPYDIFEYGVNALDAIRHAKAETYSAGYDTETNLGSLGSVTARPAVYQEWDSETWRYTNGGDFIKGERINR